MARIEIKIPTQLVLLSCSLKKNMPNKLELITIPMLTRENIVELWMLDVSNAFKKNTCLLYTSPSPRDGLLSRMPSSA